MRFYLRFPHQIGETTIANMEASGDSCYEDGVKVRERAWVSCGIKSALKFFAEAYFYFEIASFSSC